MALNAAVARTLSWADPIRASLSAGDVDVPRAQPTMVTHGNSSFQGARHQRCHGVVKEHGNRDVVLNLGDVAVAEAEERVSQCGIHALKSRRVVVALSQPE